MAIIAIILGSFVGLFGAILGWAFLGMTVVTAITFYLGCSIGTLLIAVSAAALRDEPAMDSAI